jgi:uncharacterized membrane protein YraQ (UPF0718 family)
MHRTREAAMAVVVPVVAAVVAAVIVAAVVGTALAVSSTSAGPPAGGFRQDGGNRGWEASAPLGAAAAAPVS